jgi:hypothetical protein
MNFQTELYDKYPIEHFVIDTPEGVELHQFYTPEYKLDHILFLYNENNKTYEPKIYNYKYDKETDSHLGVEIIEGDIVYEYVRCVKNVLKSTNVKTKTVEEGSLFIHQWVSTIDILNESQKYDSKLHDLERSRQTGKSFELGLLCVFLAVFGKHYYDSENEKFWVILCSYREKDGVDKLFEEAHSYLEDMIELHNKIYFDTPVFTGNYTYKGKKYYVVDKVSSYKTEINIVIDNQIRPYSIMLGLTTAVKKDGLSMDFGWLDEGFATPFEEFDRSIDPFRASTGANLVVSGISSVDSANMQYVVHNSEDSIKTKLIYPIAYNLMNITHPSRARKMKGYVESKIKMYGIDSTNCQTNYFLNWETLDGKFYTKKLMKNNKNFGELSEMQDGRNAFRVGGLDLSISHDYTVLTIVDVYQEVESVYDANADKYEKQYTWRYELRVIHTYNIDKKKMSSEKVAEDTAKLCKTYEIDMLLCDGTIMQETYVEWILKKVKLLNINTLVEKYNFGGANNKVLLMSYLETVLFGGKLKLGSVGQLKEDWSWDKLYEEMLYMIREVKPPNKNIQWHAPNSKGYTDDHVISLALACYCIPHIEKLIRAKKDISIGDYTYKAKLNKFKCIETEQQIEKRKSWLGMYV